QPLFPEKSVVEVPITHVTNGVHVPTWASPLLRWVFEKYVGQDWDAKLLDQDAWSEAVARISDEDLWFIHSRMKERLIAFVQNRAPLTAMSFDPSALTIGFARRVAGYKRWSLLLTDRQRLSRLMNNEERPVQFIFAGKAHPQDEGSKKVLQQLAQWKYDPAASRRAVFLEDYDQEIARQLVQSVDVWLNVPRRPQEASGTSGQKVGINGGLNLSILDGWWLEGYEGSNGFAIGNGAESGEVAQIDAADAESLYRVLEQEVVPLYYSREQGLPRQWIAMMRRAIQTLAPQFNSNRMVEEYARKIYP
ncbi:MAG TPA: alpha-glucan family phosphorylase, partial [Pyrinomonadaceae bacterium]|nr:alpha-glucan family phosphorylase [Pyrinomonadaceae bacterium]